MSEAERRLFVLRTLIEVLTEVEALYDPRRRDAIDATIIEDANDAPTRRDTTR